MFRSRTIRYATVLLILIAISPSITMGAGLPDKIVPCDGVNCNVCDIAKLAQNILNTGIYIAVVLSAVLFAWAGVKMLTNRANPSKISEAKSIFGYVLLGLVIILGSWLVIDTLMKTLTNQGGSFGPWNTVCEMLARHFLA